MNTITDWETLKQCMEQNGKSYDFPLIERAYHCAKQAHEGQKRRSGEPFVVHPISVAELLIQLGMDSDSIVAGLLHDVVEDTEITLAEVEKQFGETVALLVDGVTKLGKIPFSSSEEQQAENVRKVLLAMSRDIRVMIVKLCDRVHNMRTLAAMPEQRRQIKALETMEVYAPIAHRLGMGKIKEELEDTALKYLDPIGYDEVLRVLGENAENNAFMEEIVGAVEARLHETQMKDFRLEWRVKSVYGIYRKMFIQNRSLEEIYDIYAVRVILDSVADCYNVLGILHDMYRPIPQRFKDFISTPKPNGYQSLQTTVVSGKGIPFEIQIRTKEMHHDAEYGVAAHWKYKAGISGKDSLEERLAWVRRILESQKESDDATDILNSIKSDLVPEEVYVFTPKGDVVDLPSGSTAIDFAYAIHTAVGHRMVGAKVGGKIVPINYKVKTGDIIEILTGPKEKGPSRDWLNIVQTTKARGRIRAWFKEQSRDENIAEGKSMLEREIRRLQLHLTQEQYDEVMGEILQRQHMSVPEDLYNALGYGGIQMTRITPRLREASQRFQKTAEPAEFEPLKNQKKRASSGVIVEGVDNCLVRFAKCCNPMPGDEIVGFVTRGQGVAIHRKDCINCRDACFNGENAGRWIRVSWDKDTEEVFRCAIEIECVDRTGLAADITNQFANMRIPIYSMKLRTGEGRALFTFSVGLANLEHFETVRSRLLKVKEVNTVERANRQ